MKRTRYTRKYVIHLPRIAIREPGIYEITIKNPIMQIEKVGEIPKTPRKPRDGVGALERDYNKEDFPLRGGNAETKGVAQLRMGRVTTGEIERGPSDTDED